MAPGQVTTIFQSTAITRILILFAAVKFRMELDMNILGLIGTKKTATQVSSADCPITLDMTQ